MNAIKERRRHDDPIASAGKVDPPVEKWGERQRTVDHQLRRAKRAVLGVQDAEVHLAFVVKTGAADRRVVLVEEIDVQTVAGKLEGRARTSVAGAQDGNPHRVILDTPWRGASGPVVPPASAHPVERRSTSVAPLEQSCSTPHGRQETTSGSECVQDVRPGRDPVDRGPLCSFPREPLGARRLLRQGHPRRSAETVAQSFRASPSGHTRTPDDRSA